MIYFSKGEFFLRNQLKNLFRKVHKNKPGLKFNKYLDNTRCISISKLLCASFYANWNSNSNSCFFKLTNQLTSESSQSQVRPKNSSADTKNIFQSQIRPNSDFIVESDIWYDQNPSQIRPKSDSENHIVIENLNSSLILTPLIWDDMNCYV